MKEMKLRCLGCLLKNSVAGLVCIFRNDIPVDVVLLHNLVLRKVFLTIDGKLIWQIVVKVTPDNINHVFHLVIITKHSELRMSTVRREFRTTKSPVSWVRIEFPLKVCAGVIRIWENVNNHVITSKALILHESNEQKSFTFNYPSIALS